MTLGEKITALRKERGMTQEILAEEIGVTRQTISKWELDTSTPELSYLCKIADLFSVTTDYLIREDRKASEAPSELKGVETEKTIDVKMPREKTAANRIIGWILVGFAFLLFFAGILSEILNGELWIWVVFGLCVLTFGLECLLLKRERPLVILWTAWFLVTIPSNITINIGSIASIFGVISLLLFASAVVFTVFRIIHFRRLSKKK